MQYINDDMDDLLRDAADNYPLKTSGANWDVVAGRLAEGVEDDKKPAAVVVPFIRSSNKYRYALLLLLLPFAFFAAKYSGLIGSGSKPAEVKNNPVVKANPAPLNGRQNNAKNSAAKNDGTLATMPNASLTIANNGSVGQAAIAKRGGAQSNTHAAFAKQHAQLANISQPGLADLRALDNMPGTKPNIIKGDDPVVNSFGATIKPAEDGLAVASSGVKNQVETNANQTIASTGGANAIKQTQEKSAVTPPNPASQKTAQNKKAKAGQFYIGSFVAPDYTTVEYQPGSKIGFTFGGVVGYSLTSSFDIELGISAGKKYYTSNGKYFNTKLAWLNKWGKVLELSGYAGLTEFPLNFKYNFKPGKDGRFFVAAGVLSSIVHQENYKYTIDSNNIIYTRDKSTRISTNNFFSSVNISGGYESDLGSMCSFRIEPYYRIPIKGIGIGGLPITSIGLNIGIIKKFK